MKKRLLPFFLIGTIAMMVVMAKTGSSLKTPTTALGILDLEFAHNSKKTFAVMDAWSLSDGIDNIGVAKTNTYFDFLFLFFYSFLLFISCVKIAEIIDGSFGKAGYMIARAALMAGLLDVLENIGMLISLYGHISTPVSLLTFFFAISKWILVVITVLYILTGLGIWAYRKWISKLP